MSRAALAVTGASGYLGLPLCAWLAERGWEVRALVRDPDAFTAAMRTKTMHGVRAGRCDLPGTIDESLLDGVSALVHAAYATREPDRAKARRVNEDGMRTMLDAARRAGVPRVVFISTVAAHAGAPSYYARSKYEMERLLDPQRDLVVRPGMILAKEGAGLFQQLKQGAQRTRVVPLFGGGTQPLQTVHVDDVAEAVHRALDRGLTGAINVAESDPPTFAAFMRLMTERMRVRCLLLPLPLAPVLPILRAIEALHIPFPLRVESLLGMKGLRQVPVVDDLRRIELRVRTAAESLTDLIA